MKAVTGNRLTDGVVVFLTNEDQWSEEIASAAHFSDEDSADVLAAAQRRTGEIADVYLIDVDGDGAPAGRAAIRETIRARGPSVRVDLGRTAAQP